ncbi:MAG: flagellar export chaperone FlgN [Verrucomicrobia bacterium]|nr:flagellar export chaperone FlgN [Verrucomicrobiota bacterium]
MTAPLDKLITALRDELQEYGGMLVLLDAQQDAVIHRRPDDVLKSAADVQAQGEIIAAARARRTEHQRAVARNRGAKDNSFAELLPLLPASHRPLVEALVHENNELLVRVHRRAHQNHLLLSRSLELMQQFMGALFPASETLVYTGQGSRMVYSLPSRPLYDAVG